MNEEIKHILILLENHVALSDDEDKIVLDYINNLQNRIDKAIEYYESNQQECVIGRNEDDKLIKEYYLPAQCSKKMLDILKESGE